MTKKHHRKKRIPKLIRTRRFSAVVAILLIVVSAGLGYAWLRGSYANVGNGNPFSVTVRSYDVTGGQKKPLTSSGAYLYINVFQSNNVAIGQGWMPLHPTNGLAVIGGLNCIDHYYCQVFKGYFSQFTNLPAGMEVSPSSPVKANNWMTFYGGTDNATELHLRYPDSDSDGLPNKDDSCPSQAGPASNKGCPVPAPAPAPKPVASTAKPKTTASVPSRGTVATTAQPNNNTATPAAPTDSTPPNPPTDLKLTSPSSGLVTLTWAAATDDTGVTRYSVERSEDKTAWDMLNDNISETTYTDTDAAYAKKYFYRVIAYDAATNASASVDGEIVTGQFVANTKPDEESTVSSEDSMASVVIPAGAVEADANCQLVKDEEIEVSLPDGAEAKSTPYKLVCKLTDGTAVDSFKQPIKYTINVDIQAMGDLKPALFVNAGDQWQKSDTGYNQDGSNFSFESDKAETVLVAGLKQTNLIPLLVGGGVALILLIAGAIWFIRRRNSGGGGYSTDLGSASYMSTATTPTPGTPPVPVPGTTTPSATPAPNPINTEPPGQHGIHVPGEVKAPFADQQDSSMPTISHHSPLDRLNDQSTAGSSPEQPPK